MIPALAGAGAERQSPEAFADFLRLLLRPDHGFLVAFVADQHEAGRVAKALHLQIGALQLRLQSAAARSRRGLEEKRFRRIGKPHHRDWNFRMVDAPRRVDSGGEALEEIAAIVFTFRQLVNFHDRLADDAERAFRTCD